MKRKRLAMRALAVCGIFCLAAGSLLAQSASSTISGTVRDSSGATVPQAQVTITNQATGLKSEAESGSDGVFSMAGLASGTYQVTVTKQVFRLSPRRIFSSGLPWYAT